MYYMHSQKDKKVHRSVDLYFRSKVKLVNEAYGLVLNQEIHSASWSMVFLLPAWGCEGQSYLIGHFHQPTRKKNNSSVSLQEGQL